MIYFKFYENENSDRPSFSCALLSERCTSTNKNKKRCSRHCVIGTPYCWSHLLSLHHLRILKSGVPNAGKGLFVLNTNEDEGKVVFKKGELVCPYGGQLINKRTLESRYGDKTAPYAIQLTHEWYRDASCERGVGSLINHDSKKANVKFSVNQQSKTVSIKAKRNLKNGEELFVSYGREYKMHDGSKYITV